jgi:hypothetical protein
MKWSAAVLLVVCCAGAANAESCSKSLDYILSGSAGDLPRAASSYQDLFKVCSQTLTMTNVKDAYVMKDGGIAIIPKRHTVAATADVLAHFCESHPRGTLRFVTKREMRHGLTTGLVVMMSSTGAAPCQKIRGE